MAQDMGAPLPASLPCTRKRRRVSNKKQMAVPLPYTYFFQWPVFVATGTKAMTSDPYNLWASSHFLSQSLIVLPCSRSIPYGGFTYIVGKFQDSFRPS